MTVETMEPSAKELLKQLAGLTAGGVATMDELRSVLEQCGPGWQPSEHTARTVLHMDASLSAILARARRRAGVEPLARAHLECALAEETAQRLGLDIARLDATRKRVAEKYPANPAFRSCTRERAAWEEGEG